MDERINIIGGNNITIRYGKGFKKEIKTSKSAFRISKVASSDIVIYLHGNIEFVTQMSNVTIQRDRLDSPVQLTTDNWDDLTDEITEITGGSGGGSDPGGTSRNIMLFAQKNGMNSITPPVYFPYNEKLKVSAIIRSENAVSAEFEVGGNSYTNATIIGVEIPVGIEFIIKDISIKAGYDVASILVIF